MLINLRCIESNDDRAVNHNHWSGHVTKFLEIGQGARILRYVPLLKLLCPFAKDTPSLDRRTFTHAGNRPRCSFVILYFLLELYCLPVSAGWTPSLRQSHRGPDRQNKSASAERLAIAFPAHTPRCSPTPRLSDCVLRASGTALVFCPNTAPLAHQECARVQRSKGRQNRSAIPAPRSRKPARLGC